MKQSARKVLVAVTVGGLSLLTGCAQGTPEKAEDSSAGHSNDAKTSSTSEGHGSMNHKADGGPAPKDMEEAQNPEYPVGTKVTLTADHMEGMKGATATVVGAYDSTTYAVNYTPTTGGHPVKNHKWVVHEEIKNAGSSPLPQGADVTLTADHMEGMKGAKGTVASSTDETVYMVDYESGGMKMTNHKWVVESEMKPGS